MAMALDGQPHSTARYFSTLRRATEETVADFIVWCLRRGCSANQVTSACTALSVLHNLVADARVHNPFHSTAIKRALEGLSRRHWEAKHHAATAPPAPVHPPLSQRVVELASQRVFSDWTSVAAQRDLAFLTSHSTTFAAWPQSMQALVWNVRACAVVHLGLRTLLRSCEMEALDYPASLVFAADKRSFLLTLRRSKTRKASHPGTFRIASRRQPPASLCPVFWLRAWLRVRAALPLAPACSALFVGRQQSAGSPVVFNRLLYNGLRSAVQRFAQLGGVPADTARQFSVHSLRVSGSNRLRRAHFSDDTVKALGRWSSDAYQSYIRLTEDVDNPLDDPAV